MLQFIQSMLNQNFSKLPFQLYQTAKLHYQSFIKTHPIKDQLKIQLKSKPQKIQQQKLQFIKNDETNQFIKNSAAQQSHSLVQFDSNNQHLRHSQLKLSKFSARLNDIRIRGYYLLIIVVFLPIALSQSFQTTTQTSGQINALPKCNSFPKIFGGSSANSSLYHIDVYNDYLAMAGNTYDNSLTGMTGSDYIPYVALLSISTALKTYWAIAFSSKIGESIGGGVQFNSDGSLLIVHSYSISSFIAVVNTSSGKILSARSYNVGGYQNYNYRVKSIQVSSGQSPMAFVLSDYRTDQSCIGQHLFKFDPLQFSSSAIWIKQTEGTSNCGHLGLEFGKTETLIYAFSRYNRFSTVSLLDLNGNSQWQYSTNDRDSSKSNSIKYKQIDRGQDMIIATSGKRYINYNRIISSSFSPYSVSDSKTFRHITLTTQRLFGLYIKDINNAVALIYDSNRKTYLASINFLQPSISYQEAFPIINIMHSAVFTSPTVYYAGMHGSKFYKDQNNFEILSVFQSFVYSSEMTTTSCYQMAPLSPIASQNSIIMTTLTMNQLPQSIYGLSSITFVNDSQAYTTVDIVESKITKVNWCIQNPIVPFTFNTVNQAKTTFKIGAYSRDQYLAITPFSYTAQCLASGTFSYSGRDNLNGQLLSANSDLISVYPTNGTIFVSKSKPIGIYKIVVIASVNGILSTYSQNFTINITEIEPPYFIEEKPQNQIVQINTEKFYNIPPIQDPNNFPVQISFLPDLAKQFISIQGKTLKFAPKYLFQVGTTEITIILTNQENQSSNSTFNVTVFSPPEFTEKLQKLDIAILSYSNYTLPVLKDSNYQVFHPFSPALPRFVKFEYPTYFFYPQKASDIGNFFINGELCDKFAKTQFQIKVNVINQPPYLETKISDSRIAINSEHIIQFPKGVDREGQTIIYEANEKNKLLLPSFIKFDPRNRQFKFQPTELDGLKDYHIELSLIDNFKAKTIYPFIVTLFDPFKLFQNSTTPKTTQKILAKTFLSAKIESINPFGLIVIRFYDTINTSLLIDNAELNINSTNMDVRLKPFQDQNKQNQNKSITQWQAINLTTTVLKIQVNFSDPAQISQKISQEDMIEIYFKDGQLFKSINGEKWLPDNYLLMTGLPRQIVLTKQITTISEMISGGSKAMTYLVIGNIALQLFMSISMHLLWGMMNNLQLMGKMLKFNVDVPSNAYIFFKYIEEFLSMKAKFIEDYLEKFNNYIMKTTQKSGESDKDSNTSIIKNLGTIILGSVALVLAMILTAILMKFSRIPLIVKITNALKNKLFYNSILRIGVQSYLQFSIIAFASLDSRKDNTTIAIGILFLCLAVFFLIFAHIFLRKNLSSLSDPNFQQRFNSLYLNIETSIPHSYYLTTIFLLRRFLLGIVLSFCDNSQGAQFFFMNFSTFLIIIYLAKVRPLVSNYLNAIEIFNEVILYGCTGLIWGMTDYQGDWSIGLTTEEINAAYNSKQNQIGWAYIIMASTTIVMSIGGIIINGFIIIKTKLQEKCYNKNKAVKGPIEEQPPSRSENYALKKQDDSTIIQNSSAVLDISKKNERNFEIQEEPSQQIEEKFQLHALHLDDHPYNLDSSPIEDSFIDQVDEEIKQQENFFASQNYPDPIQEQESPPDSLIEIESEKPKSRESIFVSSSEFQSNFVEMDKIFKNIQVPPQPVPTQLQSPQPFKTEVFVSSKEISSIFKESSVLIPDSLWVDNNNPKRKVINFKYQR